MSTDRLGNIFINDHKGNIYKYDSSGSISAQYAPSEYGLLTWLEAWSSLRVFLFYRDTQRYTFLDRFLSANEFSEFPRASIGLISLASPSADNQLWLFDPGLSTLTKFDIRFNQSTLNLTLNQLSDTLDLDPYQLNEYQNRVYLGDSKAGILVFDNLGNFLHTLHKQGEEPFYFSKDSFYFLRDNQIHKRGLYRHQTQIIDLPSSQVIYSHALLLDHAVVLVSREYLEIYGYSP